MGGYPIGVVTFDLLDGRLQGLRFQVNPDKLAGLRTVPLRREPLRPFTVRGDTDTS